VVSDTLVRAIGHEGFVEHRPDRRGAFTASIPFGGIGEQF
jgi:hypothetical protein